MSAPRILLGQLGSNGDCLYATILARQIRRDHPDAEITWAISSQCRAVLVNNPFVDTIWEVPIAGWEHHEAMWYVFEREAMRRLLRHEFDHAVLSQIWPNNFQNFDGTIRPSILRSYGNHITVPIENVIYLTEEEEARIEAYVSASNIRSFVNRIVFECSSKSGQSFVTPDLAQEVADHVYQVLPDTTFHFSTHLPMDLRHPNSRWAGRLTLRESAGLTAHVSQFVGCGSGATAAATSTAARSLPMLQILSESTSVFASFLHDFEHFGLDTGNILEITEEDPKAIAECIVALCRDGVTSARARFGAQIPVRFEHYTTLIEQCLLRRMRFVDAAQSVSVTVDRYGWQSELVNFASTRILPNLALDPYWVVAARRRQGDDFFAAVCAAAKGDSPPPVDWSSVGPDSFGRPLLRRAATQCSSAASFRRRADTHHTRPRSDSVTQSHAEVTGWGELAPMRVRLDADALLESVAICQEEASLMQRDITLDGIPRPSSVPTHPTPLTVRSSWVENGKPLHARAAHHSDPLTVTDVQENILHNPSGRRLADLVGSTARAGPIVLVGTRDRAESCAEHLRHAGRKTTIVEPGYGFGAPWIAPGLLRRPMAGSFLHWLSTGATERLRETGAILLLDPPSAAADFRVLEAAPHSAPLLLVACSFTDLRSSAIFRVFGAGAFASPGLGNTITYPNISIITVSYNQAEYLEDCIRSVLDQGYPNLEYIVIDGGSTDGSAAIIERYRPQLAAAVIEPDNGQSDALNKGFQLATGEIMNWLCSDDMLCPGALFRIAEAFLRSPADLIVGGCVRIGSPGASVLFQHHSAIPFAEPTPLSFQDLLRFMRSWHRGHYFFQPEAFFSRRIWLESGAFIKRHLYYAMDYDLYLRMAMAGATAYHVPEMIGISRAHPLQKTVSDKVYLYQTLQLMDEYLDLLSTVHASARWR